MICAGFDDGDGSATASISANQKQVFPASDPARSAGRGGRAAAQLGSRVAKRDFYSFIILSVCSCTTSPVGGLSGVWWTC